MNKYKMFVLIYVVSNVLVTYLLTSEAFNPNIVMFETNIVYILLSICGNVSVLVIFFLLGTFVFKTKRGMCKYLIFITFVLNAFIIVLIYFTRNFKSMLSFYNLSLLRNPNAGFAKQIAIDGVKEMIFNWHFICFTPFALLLFFYLFKKDQKEGRYTLRLLNKISLLISSFLLSGCGMFALIYALETKWPFRSEASAMGIEVCGVYNYYFFELVYRFDYNDIYYSNMKETSLADFNNENPNSGLLEGYNLFLIQAESLQNFAISFAYQNELVMPFMNELLLNENVFYFNNVHTNVGLGNTSDAEFVVNTGYYPLGDLTISWEANDNIFEIDSLAKMFGEEYVSNSYNPTIEGFYAHKYVHEKFYGFNQFTGFERFNRLYPIRKNPSLYLHPKWTSDSAMLALALKEAKEVIDSGKNFYTFHQTITPHYPFSVKSNLFPTTNFIGYDEKFSNYLNQISYIDQVLYEFLMVAKEELPNTLFIIYGDHGNTLSKKSYERVLGKKLSDFEYRKMLLEIPVIIYDPSSKIKEYVVNQNLDLTYILSRMLSQLDIHTTICSLFNLEGSYKLGVDMFSAEKSFSIDPKNLDFITDDFIYNYKNKKCYLYKKISFDEMMVEVERIKRFKIANDNYITKLMS